jgi:hypothetical protein
VVFKHCFPVSGIDIDTGSPDITSEARTIENYELQYAAIKTTTPITISTVRLPLRLLMKFFMSFSFLSL